MRGDGSQENPERLVHLYFSLDGQLLACNDELNGPPDSFTAERRFIQRHADSLKAGTDNC